jgi:nucleoside recognition membrane protein YjiH
MLMLLEETIPRRAAVIAATGRPLQPPIIAGISFLCATLLPEALKTMTGDQVQSTLLGVAGIIAVAWALKGIVLKYIAEKFKDKRKEISIKKSLAKREAEKKMYEFLESVTCEAIGGMRSVSEGIARSSAERVLGGKAYLR